MATNTTNYSFKKPDESDFYDVQDQNGNWDMADEALKSLDTPTFEDYTGSTPVPAANTAIDGIKSKTKLSALMSNIKAAFKGACLIGHIVNNCVTNNPNLPLSAAQGKVLMDLYTRLNGDFGVIKSGSRKTANNDADIANILNSSEDEKIEILIMAINYADNPIFTVFGSRNGGTGCLITYRVDVNYGSAIFFCYGIGIAKNDLLSGAWSGWVKI